MYVNSGNQTACAIDAVTGKEIWACKTLEKGKPSSASRGAEKKDILPSSPSLVDLKDKTVENVALEKIRMNGGAMQGFNAVIAADRKVRFEI